MRDALLVGFRSRLLPVPPALWRREVARKAERIAGSLGWMMPDHHRVRDRCVLELSRGARPVSPAALADGLQLAVERVVTILDGLERHLTFLFRGALGEVTWAYPFTAEPTPHRLTLDSGERLYAA